MKFHRIDASSKEWVKTQAKLTGRNIIIADYSVIQFATLLNINHCAQPSLDLVLVITVYTISYQRLAKLSSIDYSLEMFQNEVS